MPTETVENISGPVFVAGEEVTSESILGSAYLSFDLTDASDLRLLATYAFAGNPAMSGSPFVLPQESRSRFAIVLGGDDFGAGSARLHPIVALAEAGVKAIVARSYSPSFHRACANDGRVLPLIAHDLPADLLQEQNDVDGVITFGPDHCMLKTDRWKILIEDPGVLIDIYRHGGLAGLWQAD